MVKRDSQRRERRVLPWAAWVGIGVLTVPLLVGAGYAGLQQWRRVNGDHQFEPKYTSYFRLLDAVERKDLPAITRELDSGADPNVLPPCDQWEEDFAILSAAAGDGNDAAVRLLLRRGADPNIGDGWNYNPLTAAAAGNHVQVMRTLVQAGARVEEDHFSIALWRAAVEGKQEAVAFLIAHGADPDEKSDQGESLQQVVISLGHPEIAPILKAGSRAKP